jgi:hypothetical protein
MGNASTLAGLLLLFGAVSATPATAQPASVDGAYAKLSPGNAKICRALHEAQVPAPVRTARAADRDEAPRPLTLDQIAAMKRGGQSWGQVFNVMKTQGLLADKSLGQVVSRYQQQQQSRSVVTTAANRGGTPEKTK